MRLLSLGLVSMSGLTLLMYGVDSKREAVDDLDDSHADYIFDIDVDEPIDGDYPRYSVDSAVCGEFVSRSGP